MPGPDLVKTGIAGLDEILSGGIPRGNVILLEGAIGCGKTTLGVEFIYHESARGGAARTAIGGLQQWISIAFPLLPCQRRLPDDVLLSIR